MLSHLIYISHRKETCTEAEIGKILESCTKNNCKVGITGVLLYTDKQFVQYLEGNYKEIIRLYDKIRADVRHKTPVMISNSPIKERIFPSWQMGSRQLTGEIEYDTTLDQDEKKMFLEIFSGQKQEGSDAIGLIRKFFR